MVKTVRSDDQKYSKDSNSRWKLFSIILLVVMTIGFIFFIIPIPYTATEIYSVNEPYTITETYTEVEPYTATEYFEEVIPIEDKECDIDIPLSGLEVISGFIGTIGGDENPFEDCHDMVRYETVTKSKEVIKYRTVTKERDLTKWRTVKKKRSVQKTTNLFSFCTGQVQYSYEI